MAIAANARQVSPDEAQSVAAEFFGSSSPKHVSSKGIKRVAPKDGIADNQPYYVFNAADNAGFVIISGDDRARKILGYSDKGNFDFDNLPPQLDWLLNEYGKQIVSIPASTSQDPSWQSTDAPASEGGVVLETANWGQGYPYNAQCPIIDGVQAPTGCVATAMAIVMKYHNWPERGRKQHHYYSGSEELSYDFSTFHPQWDNMLTTYSEENYTENNVTAVAELMHAAGIASNMQYSPTESGTGVLGVMTSLRRFFNYSASMNEVIVEEYKNSDWQERIKKDIVESKPVFYYGNGTGAHAFVIDGYNDENYFHINWGWDGNFNGFFTLNSLTPNGLNYTYGQGMIVGIHPDTESDNIWSDFFMADDKYFGSQPINSINVSVTDINRDEPFSVAIPYVAFPPYSECDLGIAIINENNSIKEILCQNRIGSMYPSISGGNSTFENIVATCNIEDSDRLQIIVQEKGEPNWKFVCNSHSTLSSTSVRGNNPQFANVSWDIDPRLEIEFFDDHGNRCDFYNVGENLNEKKNKFLCGQRYEFHPYNVDANRGIYSAIIVNDEMQHICVNKAFTMSSWAIGAFIAQPIEYKIKVMALFPGDETTESLDISTPGDLQSFVVSKNCNHVTDFTLSGCGTEDDYKTIFNNMPFIASLNLENYKPVNNELPNYCFTGLLNLSKVILPTGISKIGDGAFLTCALDNITIPESVTYIGSQAFNNFDGYFDAVNLSAVFCKSITPPEVGEIPFGNNERTTLYVMPGCKQAYSEHSYWGTFKEIIEDDNPVMDVKIEIVDGVRYKVYPTYAEVIGPADNCPDNVVLKEIVTSDGRDIPVTSIAYHAFLYSKIKKVTVPKSIVNWASSTFACAYDLTEVNIDAPIKVLPTNTFENCSSLEILNLPNTIEVIGQYAISGGHIKKFTIPTSLKEIQWNGLYYFGDLEEIVFPEENKNFRFEDGVLYSSDMKWLYLYPSGDPSRERFVIPEGVTNTFYGAIGGEKLKEVVIPRSMTELISSWLYAWYLETLVLHDDIVDVPDDCFALPLYLTIGKNVWHMGRQWVTTVDIRNIFCMNEKVLNDYWPVRTEYLDIGAFNYYSDKLNPNIILNSEYDVDKMYLYLPGSANWELSGFLTNNIHEMWSYDIDRAHNLMRIKPAIEDIEITSVLVNSETVSPMSGCYYEITSSENLDVVVNYTLHDRQAMTTHYDAEFNAQMPDTELSLPVNVTSIEITPANVKDVVGAECQLTATVMPEDATNKAVEWSSDNTEVADVDANGLLKLRSQGIATITASSTDGSGVQGQCTVTVSIPTGVEDVIIDADADVKIYSATGVLLFEGRYSDAKLDEGIYIVVTPDKQFKRLIK